ncbi:MAG: sulfurtransferase TusA family protein [Alphaproteobacteria bacterium]|tara:strand:- start:582 stop:806 length:225 start_codon:yes stop_codon:yes gene_type:complete
MPNNKFIIDLLGLKCPLPVLKANRIIKKYKTGDILEFLVNDKAAPNDFKVFCDTKKFKLLSINEDENITIKIKI